MNFIFSKPQQYFHQFWDRAKCFAQNAVHHAPACAKAAAIAIPMIYVMTLPIAEATDKNSFESTLIVPPRHTDIGFVENAANIALVSYSLLNLVGMLGVAAHIQRADVAPFDPIENQAIDFDRFDIDKPEPEEKKPLPLDVRSKDKKIIIHDKSDLRDIFKTSVLLVSNEESFTSLAIYIGHQFLNKNPITLNISHAGIVSQKIDNFAIAIHEMPDSHSSISENIYHLTNLKEKEQWLFFNFSDALPEAEKNNFNKHLLKVSHNFINSQQNKNKSNYNFHDIFKLPISFRTFKKSDWISLLDDIMEYNFIITNNSYVSRIKKYFCSEFTLNMAQIARLIQINPNLINRIKKEIRIINPTNINERELCAKKIYQEFNKAQIFRYMKLDPIFFTPANRATPADLLEFALKHNLPITRISNSLPSVAKPNLEAAFSQLVHRRLKEVFSKIDEEKDPFYNLQLKLQKLMTIDENDPDLIYLLEELEFTGFHKDTLRCLLIQCNFRKPAAPPLLRRFLHRNNIFMVRKNQACD